MSNGQITDINKITELVNYIDIHYESVRDKEDMIRIVIVDGMFKNFEEAVVGITNGPREEQQQD